MKSSYAGGGHWSKDFAEHLRTVHFALVTVSVGLILLFLTSRTYDPQKAKIQLQELLLLKSWWAPNGLALPSRFPVDQRIMSYTERDDNNNRGPIPLPDMFEAVMEDGASNKHITFTLPQNSWYWCRESKVISRPGVYDDSLAPREFPNRLRDLPQWWNSLSTNYSVQRVIDILPIGKATRGVAFTARDVFRLRIIEVGSSHGGNPVYRLTLHGPCQPRDSYLSVSDSHGNEFDFRVGHLSSVRMDQVSISERFQDLTPGRFEKTFSNVIKASRGREDLDLSLLEATISEEAAKGPEVFEAFGLRFPAEQVSAWGGIVLLGVQLYLFLYLKQLSYKLRPEEPAWDVPWIAMDQSLMAQIVVFFTFVILPFVAAILAVEQVISNELPVIRGPWTGGWLEMLKGALVLIASGILCGLSWYYRPRIKQSVSSLNIFE